MITDSLRKVKRGGGGRYSEKGFLIVNQGVGPFTGRISVCRSII